MSTPCGCCAGIETLTPISTANRPGLPALSYRVGTQATFLETMKARLSNLCIEIPENELDDKGQQKFKKLYPLRNLETRLADDPAIAFLDAWALVAHVLTFYQERIANEGYLRTATERRSILELARLVGYTLSPGVASTAYIAYTLDEDRTVTPPKPMATPIPAGARAQSVPGPGELPQSFETVDNLDANSAWNNLQIRLTRPQTKESIEANKCVHLKGITTNLKPNDPLLITFGPDQTLFRIIDVIPDPAAERTAIKLREWEAPVTTTANHDSAHAIDAKLASRELIGSLSKPPSVQPLHSSRLRRDIKTAFDGQADTNVQLLASFRPEMAETLPTALANAKVTADSDISVCAFRVKARVFGSNAQKRMRVLEGGEIEVIGEWPIIAKKTNQNDRMIQRIIQTETPDTIYLDGSFERILAADKDRPSWILIPIASWKEKDQNDPPQEATVRPGGIPLVPGGMPLVLTEVIAAKADLQRAEYGITGPTTQIQLKKEWLKLPGRDGFPTQQPVFDLDFQVIRNTTVYAQSEQLELAEEPIGDDLCGGNEEAIELAGLHSGMKPGRWLIVSGERTDIKKNGVLVTGVNASELVMLAHSKQDVSTQGVRDELPGDKTHPLPGDKTHTWITFAENLAYCYKRDTVKIWGNVAKATHGETRSEVLGSGDGSKGLQQFTLRQPPLTYVPASNPAGAASTLQVRVNDVLWHETDSLANLLPTDRKFITRTDDDGKTTVIFGNCQQGARLPTGQENIKAVYRNGIGKSGNVKADQITLLTTRPLGVKAVTNPIRASGGADMESRDQARQNVPIGMLALDRLVSTQDYTDFTRSFAGIGKANAVNLSDGQRQLVHVTIAGVDDIPIDRSSDLYVNLVEALREFGDPHAPVRVDTRELLALVVSANVRVLPDYRWEFVKPKIVGAMLDQFGFERRDLGQPVFLSEVISTIQRVPGVAYADIDVLDSVSEEDLVNPEFTAKLTDRTMQPRQALTAYLARMSGSAKDSNKAIRPAQLIFLPPDVPSTLILNEVTG